MSNLTKKLIAALVLVGGVYAAVTYKVEIKVTENNAEARWRCAAYVPGCRR